MPDEAPVQVKNAPEAVFVSTFVLPEEVPASAERLRPVFERLAGAQD